ncbi:uncharacterized protein [Drosophila virilis]|uniref:uncharacterized protein isoform X2 n=1 Tax=Drosophila virilis TaxID=7244 RepID=UPI0013963423|nr:uncharacterized protein LOC26531762 isoform X2 [Drosophila virilis]
MGKIKFNTAHSGVELHRLLHSKLKPSLPARKSSITLILQESKRRSIKLLGNMKKTLRVNQNFKLKNVKSTKLKKRLLKRLVYKIQAAKRDRKLAARLYDLKRQFKAKTALKKDSKCSKQTLQQMFLFTLSNRSRKPQLINGLCLMLTLSYMRSCVNVSINLSI